MFGYNSKGSWSASPRQSASSGQGVQAGNCLHKPTGENRFWIKHFCENRFVTFADLRLSYFPTFTVGVPGNDVDGLHNLCGSCSARSSKRSKLPSYCTWREGQLHHCHRCCPCYGHCHQSIRNHVSFYSSFSVTKIRMHSNSFKS